MSRGLVALSAVLALSGCAVGPDFQRPKAPADRAYSAEPSRKALTADGKSQYFVDGARVAADWWRLLRSPRLDIIVHRALVHNPGLEAARASLRRSQDELRAGYGVFFPQVDARAGVSRQHYNPAPGALPSKTFNLYTLSGTVSYPLDLWGGERRQVESLGARVDAARYSMAGAYVMLTSNVVDAVIAHATYRAELDATRATLLVQNEQLRISEAQATAGTAPYANVLSIRSEVATTEASLPSLEQRVDQAAHLLATLAGQTPATFGRPDIALTDLTLPAALPRTLPSQLVRQRPDVLVAEAELHAANANIGIATAALLPNLTLSGAYGVNGLTPGDLLGANSVFWSAGAGLTQPLFHGRALWYQRRAAIDARDEAAARYRQTVLGAFQQVADSLRALEHDAESLEARTRAVTAAEKALHLVQANYQAGIATYVQVLIADQQYLDAKIASIESIAQRLQDTVTLYAALGGGWWPGRS